MIYYEVLNKREQDLWNLVNYLADPNKFVNEAVLCNELQLTEFTLEQRRESVNQIWLELFEEKLTKQRFGVNDDVYVPDDKFLLFLNYLLDHSLGNHMLLDFFMDRYELKTFMAHHEISQATAYRIRRDVQEALESYGLWITGNDLVGNEATIRNLFMETLNFRRVNLTQLDSIFHHSAREATTTICAHYQLDLRPTETRMLVNLFFLVLARHNQQHFLTVDIPMSYDYESEPLVHQLETYFPNLKGEARTFELNALMMFLYAYGMIDTIDLVETPETEMIQRVHEACMDLFVKVFFTKINSNGQEQDDMLQAFYQIHWRNHLYPIFQKGFGFIQDKDWFNNFLPLFETIDEIYQKNQVFPPGYMKSSEDRYRLYYDYFYLWITYSYNKAAMRKVYICADFTQTVAMNDILGQVFNGIWFSNVVIQANVDDDTDIYLSDQLMPRLELPQLVWLNPPHYREILDLIMLVAKVTLGELDK